MASILDFVKHYQHSIEKYPYDEQKVLKCIDKLYNLGVTVQHLQETGVGRTVNALRKVPGDVGQAARALVYKWKVMVAAEESDQEGDHNNDTTNYNGHEQGKDYDSNPSESRKKNDKPAKYDKPRKSEEKEHRHSNGDYSGRKRKYHSSEEDEHDTKKSKYSSSKDNGYTKLDDKVKVEPSDSEVDSEDETSQSDSESDVSPSSDEDRKPEVKVKIEKVEKPEKRESSSTKHSPHNNHDKYKHESSSEKEQHRHSRSETRHSSDKSSKEKSNSSQPYKHSKEDDRVVDKKDKGHRSDKEKRHSEESSDRQKSNKDSEKHKSSSSEKHKSNSSSEKHKSCGNSEKHRHSSSSEKLRSDNSSVEKHRSNSSSEKLKSNSSEKHRSHSEKSSNNSVKHSSGKSDKEKQKIPLEKEISNDKHKSKETHNSSSSKDKHTSSTKEKSKDKHSSSKTDKETGHKNDKKQSSSKVVETKSTDNKRKSENNHDDAISKKSKHKSSSSSSKSKDGTSSKSKDDIPKKKSQANGGDSDDGIDCGSGASFAEALGMISPAKTKKKSLTRDNTQSPNSFNEDLSPAALLAPTAKLAPLPALEISALPEISPNYRPRPPPKFLPHFTDEDAMSAVISSKNQRTKVYSGNKVLGKIPTLYEMCVQVLQEHIDALEYTGGVPYEILKPVVDKATPQQLFMLEHYNPYLMEDTDHLWQKFCEKNFRNKKRQELETWREMYMRCQEEQEIRLKSLTANIRIAQEAKKAPIKQTKMAYVDSVVKPPRNILKKQAQHGTAFAATASPAARVASLASASNVLKGGRAAAAPVTTPSSSSLKPKKAPLMQKALQFMRGRKR